MIIPIVIGAFCTVTKGLLKELDDLEFGGPVENIQTTALLRTAGILRRVLETCCHSNSSERPSAKADLKISHGVNIMKENKTQKTVKHESVVYTNYYWGFWYGYQRTIKWTGWLGIWRTSGKHSNYSIVENG